MKKLMALLLTVVFISCSDGNENNREVEKIDGPNPKENTNLLITDSVAVPDTTTANIDPMKKIN